MSLVFADQLQLPRDPVTALETATKQYVDSAVAPAAFNTQTGTTYTLVLTDQDNGVQVTNAAAITVTVPTNASVAFPLYCRIPVRQGGAGVVTLAGASGVTLQTPNGAATAALGDGRVLEHVAANTWAVW